MRIIVAALLLAGACAGSVRAAPAPPKLVVVLSVDQLSAQLFEDYRPHFTGGLRRLADGVAFANGFQAHGATETCPGHSTILTGSHPARTGVIANLWVDFAVPRTDKTIYCTEDERTPGSSSTNYVVSDVHLRVPTFGDRLKQANPESRVVSVAGKDRSAVLLGGHNADQRWWWKDRGFVQSGSEPSQIADQVNASIARAIGEARDPLVPPSFCAARDRAIDLGGGMSVGAFRFDRKAGDAAAFGNGPERDAATLTMAAALLQRMQLGRGKAVDVLAIGLSGTDYVGHRYGPGGIEMCLQLMSLDSDLGGFFTLLDRMGLDYAVVLTADHGGLDVPERLAPEGVKNAARLSPDATVDAIGSEIGRRLGLTVPPFVGDWYLNAALPAATRSQVLKLARELLSKQPQVEAMFTKAEIAARPMPGARPESWPIADRIRASFDPNRSPDLFVVYKENVTLIPKPLAGYVATHGSVWDYDRKVPILFWWKGIAPDNRSESAMTVDIEPTLASLVGLAIPPAEIDGHCLDLVAGPETNCR
jgi:hypothetical protein